MAAYTALPGTQSAAAIARDPITLADFIETNISRLQKEWTDFARTREPAASYVPVEALTNGSKELLLGIARDLRDPVSDEHRTARSRGETPDADTAIGRTAIEHAEQRLRDGFTLEQLISEYRALRASVVRTWPEEQAFAAGTIDEHMFDELKRFNELMDQSLIVAARCFNAGKEHARDIFIGILSHDFRGPLSAAVNGNHLQRLYRDDPRRFEEANDRVARSHDRLTRMINDLLDFSRTSMGRPLMLRRRDTNLGEICRDCLDLVQSVHSDRSISLTCTGDLNGCWDPDRIAQLLSNLVGNALLHGSENTPVNVTAAGGDATVSLSVHNHGKAIPVDRQHVIFDPLRSGIAAESDGVREHRESLGLGLYISRSIAEAHGGQVELDSDEEQGTTFSVRLPRE